MDGVYVYDAIRLPRARVRRAGGTLAQVPPHRLIAHLLSALEKRHGVANSVDEVVLGIGTVTGEQAGDLARVAVQAAGWPDAVPGAVVSRLCCSGIDALGRAAAAVSCGMSDLVVAGGVESMSRVPMLSDRPLFAAEGSLGDTTGFVTIGVSADLTAAVSGFTRDHLDRYAVEAHRRASEAPEQPGIVAYQDSERFLDRDEGARADLGLGELSTLPALFAEDPGWARIARELPDLPRPGEGLHTLATAPALCDSASAVLVGSAAAGAAHGLRRRARIVAVAHAAVRSPLLTATVEASRRALAAAGIAAANLDVVEANESFAVTPLLLTRELALDPGIVNADGGALAFGHPLGATGGILLTTALDRLERTGGTHALITVPAALGLGSALVLRRE